MGRRPRRHRRLGLHHYLLMALVLPVLAGVLAVLVVRWRPLDRVEFVALVALTPFLGAPLLAADVFAWFSRSTIVRGLAAAVTAAYLFTVAPLDAVIGCGPTTSDDAITIMTANVQVGGGRPEAVAATITSADPDIVVMQEVRRDFIDALDRQPGLEGWTDRSHQLPDARHGVVVWSKWPLRDVEFDTLDLNDSVVATVDSPWGLFRLVGLHTLAPANRSSVPIWNQQFERLQTLPTDPAMVLAGDFNATEDHHPFRALLAQGWTDVHDNKGCGFDQTWPADGLPFPVMRLDHILVTDRFEVLSTEIADPGGSDHFPVISRIRLRTGDG